MKVDCNACGTSLAIEESTHFVTCGNCSSRLEVKRTENATFTELLDDAVKDLKAELVRLDTEEQSLSAPPALAGGGESILRLIVGGVLIASDVFWWITDPSMQSFYVRIFILAAGLWLGVSGLWRAIAHTRERLRLLHEAKATISARRDQVERVIADEEGERSGKPSK